TRRSSDLKLALELDRIGETLVIGLWVEHVEADRVVGAVGVAEKDRAGSVTEKINGQIGSRQHVLAGQSGLLASRFCRCRSQNIGNLLVADFPLVPFLDHDVGE